MGREKKNKLEKKQIVSKKLKKTSILIKKDEYYNINPSVYHISCLKFQTAIEVIAIEIK